MEYTQCKKLYVRKPVTAFNIRLSNTEKMCKNFQAVRHNFNKQLVPLGLNQKSSK